MGAIYYCLDILWQTRQKTDHWMTATHSEPFLKWAGGKRWLVHRYSNLFPMSYERYVEPFVGSGAVFFSLEPRDAVLSDNNRELIATYRAIRQFPSKIAQALKRYQQLHNESFYYAMRRAKPTTVIDRAARFLYLNRVCWNGLYRVNLKGEFNVPLGTKSKVSFPDGTLEYAAKLLRRARLLPSDFEPIINDTNAGDFLYVDPPYTVTHNNNGFIKYNRVLFSWSDQIRLAAAVKRAAQRGVLILVSNASHNSITQLYGDSMIRRSLTRASVLSGAAAGRRRTEEAAFSNYDT